MAAQGFAYAVFGGGVGIVERTQSDESHSRIRSVELGSLYLGKEDEHGNPVTTAPFELLRLVLPRKTYTLSHLNYVGEILEATAKNKDRIPGYRMVEQAPVLRHFHSELEPVPR
ncbi:hypothetical protein ACFV80_34035 [Streptomyces sp. NPDC059862]|uniref:hypothetical protein n=1 Tax=Streptomyces sp. NPDC059862 TaxID=3346975 RepID=UPI00365F4521